MEPVLMKDIVIIFALSIASIYLCHKARIPTIIGFFATGILAGSHGFGLIRHASEIDALAEIGIVLLLFSIGVEFSLKKLAEIKDIVIIGGFLQVGATIAAIAGLAYFLPFNQAVFAGFLVSLSSTAIVIKVLQDRGELDSPHGRTTLGILIFQDIIVVFMILFTPILAGSSMLSQALFFLIIKGVLILASVILAARWLVPAMLYHVAKTRSKELFILTVILICFAIAWYTSSLGLSLSLGAFLAGLIISESEYSQQALSGILPLRDVFASFFFISMGLLIDLRYFTSRPWLIIAVALAIILIKVLASALAVFLIGLPLRTVVLTSFALCQVGEFAFVLSKVGIDAGLVSAPVYQLFFAGSVLTMAATPIMISVSYHIAGLALRLPLGSRLKNGIRKLESKAWDLQRDHIVIVGMGVKGRNLARAAKSAGIAYTIVELNAETVRKEKKRGEKIFYGDATDEAVLKRAHIPQAKVLVIAISDPGATRIITHTARKLNAGLHIITRTHYLSEMKRLQALGADEVIPEELETSIELFSRVLARYAVPKDDVDRFVAEIRADNYSVLRKT